jgi:hypothetical protein
VFLFAIGVFALISVPLAGGRLAKLADVHVRGAGFIFCSLALQVLIVTIFPGGNPTLHRLLHLVSYGLAAAFLVANRHLPGLVFVAAGALSNATAIFANHGVMPATAGALRAAGEPATTKTFMNSTALAHPRLPFLGDIFAIPKAWPLHNIFSVGDICITIGVLVAIHTLCDSRLSLVRARQRTPRVLR